jgi:tRNA dimethylallyltransferase
VDVGDERDHRAVEPENPTDGRFPVKASPGRSRGIEPDGSGRIPAPLFRATAAQRAAVESPGLSALPTSAAPLWVVTGPTAAGKSDLAVEIAAREGLEIASMDSMAVYRRMDIGTAKPTAEHRARVRHWLVDLVEPDESFDTARWCAAASSLLDEARRDGRRLMFVGGTPLYLMAFFKGLMPGPAADPELRTRLEEREQAEPGCLHRELAERDPVAASRIHPNDLKRLVRAHEVLVKTGRPISEQQDTFERSGWRLPCRVLLVDRPRDELRERIRHRTREMLAAGLLEETRAIRDDCGFSPTSAAAIGYAECLRHLERPFKDEEELRNRIRRATHRLVRRQTTWFRRLTDLLRVPPEVPVEEAIERLRG